MSKPFEKLKACYEYCRTVTDFQPKVGLILGFRTWQLCEKHEDHMRDPVRRYSGISGFDCGGT